MLYPLLKGQPQSANEVVFTPLALQPSRSSRAPQVGAEIRQCVDVLGSSLMVLASQQIADLAVVADSIAALEEPEQPEAVCLILCQYPPQRL